jgi:hypothetical protein
MAIVATDSGGGGDFSPMPSGNHVAVCNMVVDLGKQKTEYQGETKVQHKVFIRWETPHERFTWTDRDGNEREGPRVIGKTYTLSLHENAALRGDLESWRGRGFTEEERKGFDVAKLLGAPCMVNVLHVEKNGKTYANVSSIGALPKGMDKPSCELGPLIYDDEHASSYDELPEWLRKKVDEQVRDEVIYRGPTSNGFTDDLDDSIPF